ncbi:MAG: MFS transporter [Chloroflexi bacterium]|nr:MFS transporter [Chloroflexota bacterium]
MDSLKDRNFRLFWLSVLAMGGGFWMQQFVVGWLSYDLTRSAFMTSLATGLQLAPYLVGSLVGGLVADRWDRRKFLIAILAYQAVVTAAFAVLVITGVVSIWHICIFAVAMGGSWSLWEPLRFSSIAVLVPRTLLLNAFALNGLAFNIMRFIVPAMAGFLVIWIGPGPSLLVGVAAYLSASVAAFFIRMDRAASAARPAVRGLSQLAEGFRYVKGDKLILGAVLFGMLPPFLLVPFVTGLMPVYASEVFGVEADGLGLLMACVGIGGTTGAIFVATLGDVRRKGGAMLIALGVAAVAALLFSRAPSHILAMPLLVLMFSGLPSFFALQSAFIQSIAPDALRGRIAAINSMLIGLSPLGALIAGLIAQRFGVQTATTIAGLAFVVGVIVLAAAFRRLVTYRAPAPAASS